MSSKKKEICDYSSDDTLALSKMQCMATNSRNKKLRCVASTLAFSSVSKRLRAGELQFPSTIWQIVY